MKQTSNKWAEKADYIILDPDGWDRKNYEYSWYQEEITEEEFNKRLSKSSLIMKKDYL